MKLDINKIESDLSPTNEVDSILKSETIQTTSELVHQQATNVLYSRRFGFKKYEVNQESEETLTEWQQEIEKIRVALLSKDINLVASTMSLDAKVRGDLDTVMIMLANEQLSAQTIVIIAIGIWLLREKSKWKGSLHAGLKLIKGGKFPLSSFLQKNGNATCLDTCLLFNELAKRFGITGNIYVTDNHRFGHRIWKANSGEIVDISYAWRRAGFFKNEAEFGDYVKNNKELSAYLRKPQRYVLENLGEHINI